MTTACVLMTEAFLGRAAPHVVHHSPIPVLLVALSGGKPQAGAGARR